MASGIGLGRRDRRRGPPNDGGRGYDYTQAPADLARMFGRAGRSGIEGYETALTGRTPDGQRVGNVLPLAMDEQTGAYSLEAPRMMELWNTMGGIGGKGITLGAGPGIRAYHGSPHRFDKFSLDKIGTGEGAQAYGHGLYFAESEGVARSYRDALQGRSATKAEDAGTLGGRAFADLAPEERHAVRMARDWGDPAKAAETAERQGLPERAAILRQMKKGELPYTINEGALYTTRLNVEPDDLLDWDLPLSQQSEKVRAAVEPLLKPSKAAQAGDDDLLAALMEGPGAAELQAAADAMPNYDPTGAEIYRALFGGKTESVFGNSANAREISARLREAGIPGIRYLDQGSRATGEGTRNFVIFDDSLVEIEDIANRANAVRPETVTDPDFRRLYLQGGAT